jgi:Transposase
VVAIDPSVAFKKAITTELPNAAISVDPFHLVQLANLMVTRVRQRLVREREQRRGRKVDPAWANRRLLLRGSDTLSVRAKARLDAVFASDDPTDELSADSSQPGAVSKVGWQPGSVQPASQTVGRSLYLSRGRPHLFLEDEGCSWISSGRKSFAYPPGRFADHGSVMMTDGPSSMKTRTDRSRPGRL